MVGFLYGTVDFGSGPVSGGQSDVFVAKYAPTGTLQWAKRLAGYPVLTGSRITGVAVGANDDIVVTGYFTRTIDLGGGTLSALNDGMDVFLAKFSSSGAHLWSKRFGGADADQASGVAVDGSGNIAVTGQFTTTTDLGGGALTGGSLGTVFVAKYSPSGAHLWSRSLGIWRQSSGGITVDGSGNVVVTGGVADTADFGGGPVSGMGGLDVFVAKYTPSGGLLWAKRSGGTLDDQGRGVTVATNGDVVVTGGFAGTVDFGGGPVVSSADEDAFVVKYAATGTHIWSKAFGGNIGACGGDGGYAVDTDASGNVVFTGKMDCTGNFGGETLYNTTPTPDILIVKLSASGAHLWSKRTGGLWQHDIGRGVAIGSDGRVHVCGSFNDYANFGGAWMSSPWIAAFLVQLDP
jgi:uncharacterized protein (AIM24 family)